jgi:hypothetical protein
MEKLRLANQSTILAEAMPVTADCRLAQILLKKHPKYDHRSP